MHYCFLYFMLSAKRTGTQTRMKVSMIFIVLYVLQFTKRLKLCLAEGISQLLVSRSVNQSRQTAEIQQLKLIFLIS